MSDLIRMAVGVAVAACVGAVAVPHFLAPDLQAPPAVSPPVARAMQAARTIESISPESLRHATGSGPVTIEPDRGGHYRARVEIQGRRIPMLVDTGATLVALSEEDAHAVGVFPMPSDYTVRLSTANGEARGAAVMLREVRIDNIVARDVQAVVLPRGLMGQSLLGMSFLRKLRGFEIAEGRLVLKP